MPWNDAALSEHYRGPDLAVAWAVKWTLKDHLVVVNLDPAYRIGAQVRAYAKQRGVRILLAPPTAFDPILIARYRHDHEVPIRSSWQPPAKVWSRFVEPVPGFDEASDYEETEQEVVS